MCAAWAAGDCASLASAEISMREIGTPPASSARAKVLAVLPSPVSEPKKPIRLRPKAGGTAAWLGGMAFRFEATAATANGPAYSPRSSPERQPSARRMTAGCAAATLNFARLACRRREGAGDRSQGHVRSAGRLQWCHPTRCIAPRGRP